MRRARWADTRQGPAQRPSAPLDRDRENAPQPGSLDELRRPKRPYLQGRLHLEGFGPEAARRALEAVRRERSRSIRRYAAAHAAAALSLPAARQTARSVAQLTRGSRPSQIFARRSRSVQISRKRTPRWQTSMFLYDWDWGGAEREYRRSLDLNPGFVTPATVFAQLLAARGASTRPLAVSEETTPHRPAVDRRRSSVTAWCSTTSRDFDAAGQRGRAAHRRGTGQSCRAICLLHAWRRRRDGSLMDSLMKQAAATCRRRRRQSARARHSSPGVVGRCRMRRAWPPGPSWSSAARSGIRSAACERPSATAIWAFGRNGAALDAFDAAFSERDPALVWFDGRLRASTRSGRSRASAALLRKLKID